MVTRDGLAVRLFHASVLVITSERELIEADAQNGPLMVEIASAVSAAVAASDGSIRDLFEDVARAVSRMEGRGDGAAFWSAWFDGLAEAAPNEDEVGYEELAAMFDSAFQDVTHALAAGLCSVAPTDVLAVACVAVSECDDELDAFDAAADSVEEGITDESDVVALALARFLRGMAQA